jgi:hypothetical protein
MEFKPEIRKLDLDLNPDKAFSMLMLATTRAGKSTLMNYLLSRYFVKKICVLMTQSPAADVYKEGFFKSKDIVIAPDYMPELIKDCYQINKATDNNYGVVFVVDDVVGKREDTQMKKLSTIYRNSNLSVIISGQQMAILNTQSRANTNYIFLGRLGNQKETQNVVKEFLSGWFPLEMKLNQRIREYERITKNYHYIVIDNIKSEIYVSKAPI